METGPEATPAETTSGDTGSLYDRVGDTAIAEIVDVFYVKVLADPEIGPYFTTASLPRLQHMQRELFAAALGAPTDYAGGDLHDVHAMLGIRRKDFSKFMEHLVDTLDELSIDADAIHQLISRLSLYADDIVGGQGEDG